MFAGVVTLASYGVVVNLLPCCFSVFTFGQRLS